MVAYTGINHLAMATRDMDATLRFWRDLLGMRLVAGIGHAGFRHYFLRISDRDMLAFFEWPDVEPLPEKDHGAPVKGPLGFDHVSFGVASDDDLWELKDKLDAAGRWVSEVVDHGFIHSIYAFDPNGIAIEFSAPVPGVDVRENPVMVDRDASAVTLEGPEPQPGKWPEPESPTPPEERRTYPGDGRQILGELVDGDEGFRRPV